MPEDTTMDLLKDLEKIKQEKELKKAIAEAEKAIAEAEKAKFAAGIPTGSAKPIEGAITTGTDSGYMAEVSAYDAMAKLADRIARRISTALEGSDLNKVEAQKPRVLIVDSLDFVGEDALLLQITEQLGFWSQEFATQKQAIGELLEARLAGEAEDAITALGLLALVSGVLSSTADIVGFFQTSYEITGRKIEKSDAALRLRVADRLDCPVYFQNFHRMKSSKVLTDFKNCLVERKALVLAMAALKSEIIDKSPVEIKAVEQEIQNLQVELAKLKSPEDDVKIEQINKELTSRRERLEKKERAKNQADTTYARSEALIKVFDEFNTELTSVPDGKSSSPLAVSALRQSFDELGITHLLYLTITSIGGEVIAGKGLWRSGNIAFLGGCVASYALADNTGNIMASDTIAGSSYVKFNLGQESSPEFSTL